MHSKEHTVKSRVHHGTNILDLTIPSEIVRSMKINPGDVFRLIATEEKGTLVLRYERVYATKP